MKKTLLNILLLLFLGVGNLLAAPTDYLTGWTEVTSLPTDNSELEKYYYAIVEGDMMIAQDYATAPDAQEGRRTAVYKTPCDPTTNTKVVWLLSYSNEFEYGLRNYAFQDRYMQSRGDEPFRLQAEWEANQSRWTRMALTYADGSWTIQNKGHVESNFGTNFWGSWGEGEDRYTDGYCLAGNKGFNGSDTYVGKFKIYSLPRTSYAPKTGIFSMPYSTDFASMNPFVGGSVVNGGSVQSVLNVNNTTATATFNVNDESPYTLADNEEVTVSFTAFHGWLTNGVNQTVTLYNSDNVILAQYTYNLGACNLTGVTVANQAQSVTAYNCQSFSNYGGRNANGLTGNQSYKTTAGYNPEFTFVVSKSGRCSVNVKYTHHNIDNTYTATAASDVKMDLAKLVITSGSNNGDRTICIDNLNITSEIKTTPKADFTIKYVDENGTEIKESTTGNDEVGSNPVVGNSDKESIINGDVKYNYASDDASSQTIAEDGSTVVTVHFNTIQKFDYSVTSSLGSTIATGSIFTDETAHVTWNKYVNAEGKWYVTEAPYGVTLTSETPTKVVEYVEAEIANFFEAESILSRNYGNPNGDFSGGVSAAIYTGATLTMSNINAGTYSISVNSTVRRSNEDKLTVQISTDGTNWTDAGVIILTSNVGGDYSVENITLPADGTIRLVEAYNQNFCHYVDYVVLEKTADASIERATATNKYGTICAPFAATATGATVYSAAINGESVTLTEVGAELQAGVPYIYQATADAQTFTCTGASVAAPATAGPLTGVFAATEVPVGSYVMQTLEGVQAFYIVEAGAQPTLSAYKAYLSVPSSAKSLKIGFGEETAIKAIDALTSGSAKIYDVNGRELKSLQKGVNIVNGVKVLVK